MDYSQAIEWMQFQDEQALTLAAAASKAAYSF